MGQIGSWFAPQFPDALIVSIGGWNLAVPTVGSGFAAGVTEENRQQRIDAIMPTFIEIVRYWQEKAASVHSHRADRFLSGAIMSLESIKAAPDLASRVIAFNGRYATLPETATTATTIHLIHGVKIGLSTGVGGVGRGGVTAGGRRRDLRYCRRSRACH